MPKIPTYLASLGYEPPRGDVDAAAASGRSVAKVGDTAIRVIGDYAERAADRRQPGQTHNWSRAVTWRQIGSVGV